VEGVGGQRDKRAEKAVYLTRAPAVANVTT